MKIHATDPAAAVAQGTSMTRWFLPIVACVAAACARSGGRYRAGSRRAIATRRSFWTSPRATTPKAQLRWASRARQGGCRSEAALSRASGSRPGSRSGQAGGECGPAPPDPRVRQDLDILIKAARSQAKTLELNRKYLLPFFDLPQAIFSGFQNLLDSRVPRNGRRMRSFACNAMSARRRVTSRSRYWLGSVTRKRRQCSADRSVDRRSAAVPRQSEPLSRRHRDACSRRVACKGWQKDMKALRRQVDDYGAWARATVLPRARKTSQLPAELYADNLKTIRRGDGSARTDRPRDGQLWSDAQRNRNRCAGPSRHNANGPSTSYRDVIRELKKERSRTTNCSISTTAGSRRSKRSCASRTL